MTIKNEKIFITGGAGFIGTALTRFFLNEDNHVVIFDSFKRNSMRFFPELKNHPSLQTIQGDVLNLSVLKQSIADATYVFHLAAIAGVSKYFSIPADVIETNIIGTYNILESIKGNPNIKALVDFSTSEIYGSDCFNAREDDDAKMENLSQKRWTYATSKIASEKFCMGYYWQHKVPFIGVRPFNIYGPGQVGEGVVSYFLNNAMKGESLRVTGDGSQCRTYCYIDDFIAGISILLQHLENTIGNSYNVGRANEITSVLSMAELVQEVTACDGEIQFIEHHGEDVMVRSPNIDKIKALGYVPKVCLKEGLKHTYDWYINHQVELD